MTRINVIDVKDLADQHLMAEYRELPMVHGSLKRTLNSKRGFDVRRIPAKYTLNTGHVTFFYNKAQYLYNRYNELVDELRNRGYEISPEDRVVDWNVFPDYCWKDYQPTVESQFINAERIVQRLSEKTGFYNYNRSKISVDFINTIKEKYIGAACNI